MGSSACADIKLRKSRTLFDYRNEAGSELGLTELFSKNRLNGGNLRIKKKLFSGSLMPHKLNSRFQKILQEEFYKKPKDTYRKYLGSLIDEEEDKIGLIRMEEKDFNSVKDESFPFVFLDEAVANRLQIAPGRELNLQIGDDGSNRLQRKVFSSKLLSVKDARKYGYKKKKVVCFVTENL